MIFKPYKMLESEIIKGGKAVDLCRWECGRYIVCDLENLTKEGNLKHGRAEMMIAWAKKLGGSLHQKEIQRRARCARAYINHDEIGTALSRFDGWNGLIEAGFPAPPPPPEGTERGAPYNPWTDSKKGGKNGSRGANAMPHREEQGYLWWDWVEPTTTLGELEDACDKSEAMTARFAARDALRRAEIIELLAGAGGDRSMTKQDAEDIRDGNPGQNR